MSEESPKMKKFVERLIDRVDALIPKLSEGDDRRNLTEWVEELRTCIVEFRVRTDAPDHDERVKDIRRLQFLLGSCSQAMVRNGETMPDEAFRIVLDWESERIPGTISTWATRRFYARLDRYLKVIEVRNESDYEELKKKALELKELVDQIVPDKPADRELMLKIRAGLDTVYKDMRRFNI
jgi:hypothetical protein